MENIKAKMILMFKAVSSKTRRKMLKILSKKQMHVSGISRELGISTPVASKHLKILENAGLVEKAIFGRSHVFKARTEKIYKILDEMGDTAEIEVLKGANVLDALKQVAGVELQKIGEREFVTSIDGEEGYYVYEVNGKLPDIGMDSFKFDGDVTVELKKILHVRKKKLNIKVKLID